MNRVDQNMSQKFPDRGDSEAMYELTARELHPILKRVREQTNNITDHLRNDYVNIKWFGAKVDGETDDTAAVQDAIDYANEYGTGVLFPVGTTAVRQVKVYGSTTIRGVGQGGYAGLATKSVILRYDDSEEALVVRHGDTGTGTVANFCMRDIEVKGINGAGGTGILLTGFRLSYLSNVYIGTFRNSADTGVGLSLTNLATAGCVLNNFFGVTIGDSDTGLLMDTASGVTATGYNVFHGLTVFQEETCISLKNTAGNGSIYNTFSGTMLQGNNAVGRKGLYCEGQGNSFLGLVIDAVDGNHLEFTTTASGNILSSLFCDASKIVNNNTVGASNTIFGGSQMAGGVGQPFVMEDNITGATTLSLRANGAANGSELRYATDVNSIHFRTGASSGAAGAHFRLTHHSAGTVQRWNNDGTTQLFDDLIFSGDGIGPRLIDRTTATVYRLYVDGGALLIEAV